MLVEAPILGGEHRLDQVVGVFLERDRIVVANAARPDLVTVAVEEGDGELRFLQPVVVGGLVEGRDRQCQHQDQAAGAQRCDFREEFDGQAPPPGNMETVHEGGEPLVILPQPGSGMEHRRIQPRIQVEQEPPEPRPPVVRQQIGQGSFLRHQLGYRVRTWSTLGSFAVLAQSGDRSQWGGAARPDTRTGQSA